MFFSQHLNVSHGYWHQAAHSDVTAEDRTQTRTERTDRGQTGQEVLTLAVDSYCSVRALTDVQEAAYDDVTRRAAIQEEEVIVVETGIGEAFGVVDLLVQTDDRGHVVFPEVGEVRLGGVERVTYRGRSNHRCSEITSTQKVQDGCCPDKQTADPPFSILVLGWGPLKAKNFPGTIQFRSPFSTRSKDTSTQTG